MPTLTAGAARTILAHLLILLGGASHFPLQVRVIRTTWHHKPLLNYGSGEGAFMENGDETKRFFFKYQHCQPLQATKRWNYPAQWGNAANVLLIVPPNNHGLRCRLETWPENPK